MSEDYQQSPKTWTGTALMLPQLATLAMFADYQFNSRNGLAYGIAFWVLAVISIFTSIESLRRSRRVEKRSLPNALRVAIATSIVFLVALAVFLMLLIGVVVAS